MRTDPIYTCDGFCDMNCLKAYFNAKEIVKRVVDKIKKEGDAD